MIGRAMIGRAVTVRATVKKVRRRRGITLVEVVISILLVSTVLLVSLSASANLLRNDAQQQAAAG
ncbi:MAG: prepilin-type N-terminal cleavage/methylation domain-containing protein, partial [Pirellulales bacterium]|nr:prepilin-type N-terminal cleavage/methylation domain-containing protein [Pirellulales bacterium]